MKRFGSKEPTMYGPLPVITSSELSSKDLPSQSSLFKIGRNPNINGNSRSIVLNSNLIFRGPVTFTVSIFFQLFKYLGCPIVPKVENDHMTSSTVTGDPSENLASFLNLNSTHVRFGPTSIVSAKRPYNENGSFQFRPIKLSTTWVLTPQGALPFLI